MHTEGMEEAFNVHVCSLVFERSAPDAGLWGGGLVITIVFHLLLCSELLLYTEHLQGPNVSPARKNGAGGGKKNFLMDFCKSLKILQKKKKRPKKKHTASVLHRARNVDTKQFKRRPDSDQYPTCLEFEFASFLT